MSKQKIGSSLSVSLLGLEGKKVDVQCHITNSLPGWTIVGLPDASLNESKSRISSALRSAKIPMPEGHITVNLAPASLPKKGSSFDLAIAVALLAANSTIKSSLVKNVAFIGELGLDARIHGVNGVLPMVRSAYELGVKKVFVPLLNVNEAKLVENIEVVGVGHLYEVLKSFEAQYTEFEFEREVFVGQKCNVNQTVGCFSEILGQSQAKSAMEIAAVGGHNMLMIGPPGTGKTMLASRFIGILPPLNKQDALAVSSILSLSGRLDCEKLIVQPPFEAPHHTATAPSIIGGGSSRAVPGAVSRAHKGVLFLDEAPEFSPRVLQTLRQPLENGYVTIDRVKSQVSYPAEFQLILAANPCPCGMANSKTDSCKCSSIARARYFSRLSGPLLDRIDITTQVLNITKRDYHNNDVETSADILKRVIDARKLSSERLKNTPWQLNSQVPGSYYRKLLGYNNKLTSQLSNAVDKGIISMRGADRAIRVAWSICDLRGGISPDMSDLAKGLDFYCRAE